MAQMVSLALLDCQERQEPKEKLEFLENQEFQACLDYQEWMV